MYTSAYTHTLLSSLHPSIQLCAVKSLTPAVVVSWFKESVITSGDELACEYQQHRVEGGVGGWDWGGRVGMAPGGGNLISLNVPLLLGQRVRHRLTRTTLPLWQLL